ncbi:hypothetical protein DPSP01_004249 [Paraphaeosphaeria sporulosa]
MQPKRGRYIAPFIEPAGLEQNIQETVQDFKTVVPSGAFLSGLLNTPVTGLADAAEVHTPLHELEGSISSPIQHETQNYIKYCYQTEFWSFEKLLYTVVVDTPNTRIGKHKKAYQYVSKVEVQASFACLEAAVACISTMVDRWEKDMGNHQGKIITHGRARRIGRA